MIPPESRDSNPSCDVEPAPSGVVHRCHHTIGRLLRDPRHAGCSPHGAALLEQGDDRGYSFLSIDGLRMAGRLLLW